jgi:hypothetical protein
MEERMRWREQIFERSHRRGREAEFHNVNRLCAGSASLSEQ